MNLKKAAQSQLRLAKRLNLHWEKTKINRIAGADFGYDLSRKTIVACIVVFQLPQLKIIETKKVSKEVTIPYVRGYLSFREGPAFMEAFKKIKHKPNVTFIDGNGIAHPRWMGLASFVGVILDICTVGCAKKPYYPFTPPGIHKGNYTYVYNYCQEKVGICLRTRTGVKPIFVSPGHRIDFNTSRRLVLHYSRFRIPQPIREAHRLTRKV